MRYFDRISNQTTRLVHKLYIVMHYVLIQIRLSILTKKRINKLFDKEVKGIGQFV